MNEKLYTIILSHYNQMEYIEEAIKSILIQNYPKIEIIVIDDGSKVFDKKQVENFINKNKKENIINFNVLVNDKNIGTTRSLNRAIAESNGEYIHFFAADDALHDETVISKFVKSFNKNKMISCVTSQCLMYDKHLKDSYAKAVDEELALKYNNINAIEQYKKLAFSCMYGAGGTSYRKDLFNKIGIFNEKYKLVEDWSFWLRITEKGEKILYENFISLKHREGGVSHSLHEEENKNTPPHVIQYYKDILNIFENEILNDLKKFSLSQRNKLIDRYRDHVRYYSKSIPEIKKEKTKYTIKLIIKNPGYFFIKSLNKINYYKQYFLSIIVWYILTIMFLSEKSINMTSLTLLMLLYISVRTLIRVVFFAVKKVINNVRKK